MFSTYGEACGPLREAHANDEERGAAALRGEAPHVANVPQPKREATARSLRVVTYNVHGCVGQDGVVSESRVAEVLAEIDADVAVLQELDVGRPRSQRGHQPERIASALSMHFLFCAAVEQDEERYGHAIISRWPLKLVRSAPLPQVRWPHHAEPRSALWAEIAVASLHVQIMGTHLSLWPLDRLVQASALLGRDWMGSADWRGPRVLCGDLNVGGASWTYHRLRQSMRDAQSVLPRARSTYPAKRPMFRLDHVFASEELRVEKAGVVATTLAKVASDHLPLVADLCLTEERS